VSLSVRSSLGAALLAASAALGTLGPAEPAAGAPARPGAVAIVTAGVGGGGWRGAASAAPSAPEASAAPDAGMSPDATGGPAASPGEGPGASTPTTRPSVYDAPAPGETPTDGDATPGPAEPGGGDEPGAGPTPTPGNDPAPGSTAGTAPLTGNTGGGTVLGSNPIRALGPDRYERPVVLLGAAAAQTLAVELDRAGQAHAEAAVLAATAAENLALATGELERLDEALTEAEVERDDAHAALEQADDRVTSLAIGLYIGGAQPADLGSEVVTPGASIRRAASDVRTRTAIDRRIEVFSDARARLADAEARRRTLRAERPAASLRLAAAGSAAQATADLVLDRAAELDEARHRHDLVAAAIDDPAVERVPGDSPLTFPVAGEWEFIDSWGYPRSGGRSHKGTDVFAPAGTPLVAIEDGTVSADADPLGGLVVYLRGVSGTTYYYAHLQAIAPAVLPAPSGGLAVEAGDLVGWVGNTGNAWDTPAHLHIQIATVGYAWENPYPLLSSLATGVMQARRRGASAQLDAELVALVGFDRARELLRRGSRLSPAAEADLTAEQLATLRSEGVLSVRPAPVAEPQPVLAAG